MTYLPTAAFIFVLCCSTFTVFPSFAEDAGSIQSDRGGLSNRIVIGDINAANQTIKNIRSLKFDKVRDIPAPKGVEADGDKTLSESEVK